MPRAWTSCRHRYRVVSLHVVDKSSKFDRSSRMARNDHPTRIVAMYHTLFIDISLLWKYEVQKSQNGVKNVKEKKSFSTLTELGRTSRKLNLFLFSFNSLLFFFFLYSTNFRRMDQLFEIKEISLYSMEKIEFHLVQISFHMNDKVYNTDTITASTITSMW